MVIAVASGKGGTGKTTIATNLAEHYRRAGKAVQLLDADVEAPNCHLFLQPQVDNTRPVTVGIPEIDAERCTRCGECGRICAFGAILATPADVIVFPELCHSCGGCMRLCPEHAIREVPREIGRVEDGHADGLAFAQGRLDVGEPRPVPVITELKRRRQRNATVILDAPPGTSCAVIEAVRDADFACLVTEPTPFGLYDLQLAVDLCRTLALPFGVVINRAGLGDNRVHRYCEEQSIRILAEIENDRRLAGAHARGELLLDAEPSLQDRFASLASEIEACAPN